MTPSQYNAWLRQQQQRQNDAIRRHNAEIDRVNRANRSAYEDSVRRYNAEVDRVNRANRSAEERHVREVNADIDRVNRHNRKVVDDYNREVRNRTQAKRIAVDRYNQYIRAHNAQVQRDKNELTRQISSLRSRSATSYVEVRSSTFDLVDSYARLEQQENNSTSNSDLLALSEREASNSITVAEALISEFPTAPDIDDSGILDYLSGFSEDLCDRWRGALFALNPSNADAARHFCTSVREIFTEILDGWAESKDVLAADANCDRTPNGTPSRRARIQYLLRKKGADSPQMLGFVEKDIDDILQLFKIFNEATHGSAGNGLTKLLNIRQRVEGGIMFLATVAL
jgi:hypothetical protein